MQLGRSAMAGGRRPVHLAILLALQAACPVVAQSPVQQVIRMLTDMKAKGAKEKEVESMTFAAYGKFVRGRTRELEHEISSAKAQIEELTADIGKHDSDVQTLGGQIREIDGQVGTLEADQKAAAQMREKEHSEFLEEQTSYTESLYALDRAIQMLKAQSYDREQATALLQRTAKTMPGMRRVLAALELLQIGAQTSDLQPSGAPAVAAYEFQSGSIVDMLEQLRKKFKDELGQLQKEEMNMAHAYSMQELHSSNTVSNLKTQGEALTESKLRIAGELAAAKEELGDTKASLSEAQKFLSEMTATFATKKAIFEDNQQVRTEEMQAIQKALEIMSAPEVTDSYAQHVKSLAQLPARGDAPARERRPATFLQVHSASGRAERGHAAKYLQGRARELRSEVLATLAQQMGANPFAKVVDMIKSLLARLKEEAASEADHKAFCDEELRTNKLKREKLGSAASRLHAEIEEKTMAIAKMANQIAALAEEQAELRKSMVEATEARQKEKAANAEAVEDSAAGQVALGKAIAVLQDFYSKQGGSLLQVSKGAQVPEMEAYGGMLGEKGGVVGMLEVIKSDFARVEADTRAAETQAADEYKRFTSDSEADLKLKHDSEFKLSLKKDQAEFEKGQLQKDLDATQEQLDMANKYYGELKPQCVTVHVTYEERAAKRKEEIKALQEAYRILDGKSAGL